MPAEDPTPAAAVEVVRLRYDGEPFIAPATEEADAEDRRRTTLVVADAADREALRYVARPPGWRELRSFVEGTDLSAAVLLVSQEPIGECYRRRVVHAAVTSEEVDVRFCEQLRPATVACERDRRVMETIVVRLSAPEGSRLRGYSVGYGGTCRAMTASPEGDA